MFSHFLLSTFCSSKSLFSRGDPRLPYPIQLSSAKSLLQAASLINSITCSKTPILKRLIQNPWFIDFVLLIFMQMSWEYLDLLIVGKHLFKFSDCCKPYGSSAQTRSWLSWTRYSNIYYQTSNRQQKRFLMYVPRHIFKRLIKISSLE